MGTGYEGFEGNQPRVLSVVGTWGVLGVSTMKSQVQCPCHSCQGVGFCRSRRLQGLQVAFTMIAVYGSGWGFHLGLSGLGTGVVTCECLGRVSD